MKFKSVTQFGLCGISHYLVLIFILFMWEHHKKTSAAECDSLAKMQCTQATERSPFPKDSAFPKQREKTIDGCDGEMSDRNIK